MQNVANSWPGIFVIGEDVLIEHNEISVVSNSDGNAVVGRGGLQIGGGSSGVRIKDNLIRGGIGNGITLGSIVKPGADNSRPSQSQ